MSNETNISPLPFGEDWGEASPFDAVILGAGDYPTHAVPLKVLGDAPFVCCCDSAAKTYIAHGHMPDAIVGDGDSLPNELKKRYADIWHQVDEQDDNDQTKATRHCVALGKQRIAYVGATGRREDHTLGNISLMANYLHSFGIRPTMFTDYGCFFAVNGKQTFASYQNQKISLFNLSARNLSSHGLKWEAYPFTEWWQGTLNVAIGNEVTIECDGDVIVFAAYKGC